MTKPIESSSTPTVSTPKLLEPHNNALLMRQIFELSHYIPEKPLRR